MYYSNTPRHKWTALDVMVEEMDPTPLQMLEQWDLLQKKMMLDQNTVETKKDFIKWEINKIIAT